ncbi:MAG TPA: hypothetical protein VFB72_04565, partial [Verrucomicrobiae bacterium]|nr:hypothetical protein [Verrucomicrobiae bacterium]
GMAVSSMCRDARQAIATTFLLMLIFAGLLPSVWWLQRMTINNSSLDFLLWPSPVTTYISSLDNRYKYGAGARFFWESLGTLYCLGLFSIIIANLVLPHSWQDNVHTKKEKNSTTATKDARGEGRIGLLELLRRYEPALWLALRDPTASKGARRLYLLFLPAWFSALLISVTSHWSHEGFIIAMLVAYAMHVAIKVIIATEATRRMNLDRRNGAWELLLVTPLTVRSIVSGQKKALWRHFRSTLFGLAFINVLMIVVVEIFHKHLDMTSDDRWMFRQVFFGGIVVLFADFQSLGWVGMWLGLKTRQHHRAVLATLGQIMGLPLIFIFLLFVIQPGFRSIRGPLIMMALWFGISMALDAASAMVARRRLLAEFRSLVAAAHG